MNLKKYLGIAMLFLAIGFNLWIYRAEPTALVDPNDNTFQFALVHRTNEIWDYANKTCAGNREGSHPAWAWKDAILPMCHLSLLIDHWVPNWAEGYNLPYYYSHIPQIVIVASYKFISAVSEFLIFNFQFLMKISNFKFQISLFQYYHLIIYLLLSLFPLSVFLSLRLVRLPYLTAAAGALLAPLISTDGFYGLDASSFVWRGYGLSSQLFAGVWLPLSIAYAFRTFADTSTKPERRSLIPAILSLAAVTSSHLGIGVIAFLSIAVIAIANPLFALLQGQSFAPARFLEIWQPFWINIKKLLLIYGGVFLLLGYWIIPIALGSNFHNLSYWDPIWKFDSYGAGEILTRLFNGNLFDFDRLPLLTILVFVGLFRSMSGTVIGQKHHADPYVPFALLFVFWILLYFGRTTWGSLIDLIPGMTEFHLSRMIVGVHLAGLFLVPLGLHAVARWLQTAIQPYSRAISEKWSYGFLVLLLSISMVLLASPPLLRYASHNGFLITRANAGYREKEADFQNLLATLTTRLAKVPGRVYPGRGGNWGRDFRIAETPMYLYLSTYGIPTVLWMPQTWSPSSDVEQYFDEGTKSHYDLFGVRYVVAPPAVQPQPFWTLLDEGTNWKLYGVEGSEVSQVSNASSAPSAAFFTAGIRPAIVASNKDDFKNLVRLWIQSDYHTRGLYPQLILSNNITMKQLNNALGKNITLPRFIMEDEATYETPDLPAQAWQNIHILFAEPPRYVQPQLSFAKASAGETIQQYNNITIENASVESDMVFRARVNVPKDCTECIIILRQTYHPGWRATIDGEPAEPFAVFPFFTAISLEAPGTYEVVFRYAASPLKIGLLYISLATLLILLLSLWRSPLRSLRRAPANSPRN